MSGRRKDMDPSELPSEASDGPRIFSIIRGGAGPGAEPIDDERGNGDPQGVADDSAGDTAAAGRVDDGTGAAAFGEAHKGSSPINDGDGQPADDIGEQGVDDSDGRPVEEGLTIPSDSIDPDELDAVEAIVAQATALLDDADPLVYYRAVKSLVREGHSQVLGPLDYSPDFPFHSPSTVFVDPAASNTETAQLYAHAAYPDFDQVLLAQFTDPVRADLLVALYDLLFVEGRNVALITNHGQIIDIALVVAALFIAMSAEGQTFGVLGDLVTPQEMADRCNTLVSRMVATRQAFGIPAVQVLQSVTRVYLSVPQTASRRRAKMDPSLVKANNALMRFELEKRLTEGGQILAMAASGTQDLTIPQLMNRARAAWRTRRGDDPGEQPTLHLQPLFNGTISLMRSCEYVLPVAVSLDSRTPAMRVGSLTRLREDEDCHRVMDWIALTHQEATGIPTIYHRPGDDLLTQVKALIGR